MADKVRERPFDNFRVAITDPYYFFGRSDLLKSLRQSPFQVRVLLGGRRLGKTSALRAAEWSLLDPNPTLGGPRRAFPVFISLQVEQPEDLGHLRYLLIARLREAMDRWQRVPGAALREMYRWFLHQVAGVEVSFSFIAQLNVKVNARNPALDRRLNHDDFRQGLLKTIDELRAWQFEGVCFLLDETDFIVRQAWANDAWSYFRGLKDTDTALKPFFGFLLAGYRDLKNYQQQVGSPLVNIAKVEWLTLLTEPEVRALVSRRAADDGILITTEEVATIMNWTGCHPYLTQQMLNAVLDDHLAERSRSLHSLVHSLLHQHDHDFSAWWNPNNKSDGFSDAERAVYRAIVEYRTGTDESLARPTGLSSGKVADALEVLAGTGVIRQLDKDESQYTLGAQLFKAWVSQQEIGP